MKNHGFTLIEIVIAVAILIILAGALSPAFTSIEAGQKYERTRSDMELIAGGIRRFAADMGRVPRNLDELLLLTAANSNPPKTYGVAAHWLGPYVQVPTQGSGLTDAWSTAFALTKVDVNTVRLRCLGENRKSGDTDDLVLTVSIMAQMRERSAFVAATVTQAISSYYANYKPKTGLSSNITTVVNTLKSKNLLSSDVDWTKDAWGRALIPGGTPVSYVRPKNETGLSSGNGANPNADGWTGG